MEPLTSIEVASALLGIAALGGLTMAGIRLSGKPRPPSWLAMLHGVLAAAALTILIYAALTVGVPPMTQMAIGVLVLAAVGGAFINLVYHSEMQPLPIPLVIGHALVAVVGFVLLLLSLFNLMHATAA